jgi:hypothetical protein
VGGAQIKNALVTLTSQNIGSTSGFVFWQDCYPKATTCTPSAGGTFNGNGSSTTNMLINGTVYMPHQTVTIAGNSTFLPTQCTAIVADIIDFQGQGSISHGCLPIGGGGGFSVGGTFRLAE